MVDFNRESTPDELAYPAEFHFRVICDSAIDVTGQIVAVASNYQISRKLNESNSSRSGRYRSYSISVIFEDRTQMMAFDETVKAIPGVRMLL
jgi:putative lipoic acid-binding regulatory protein